MNSVSLVDPSAKEGDGSKTNMDVEDQSTVADEGARKPKRPRQERPVPVGIDAICKEVCTLGQVTCLPPPPNGIPLDHTPGSSQRYYSGLLLRNVMDQGEGFDQVLNVHPNGLIVVCLSPSHPAIVSAQLSLAASHIKIEYASEGDKNFLDAQPTGKKKSNALSLMASSVACHVNAPDGTSHPVYACADAHLLEVNFRLVKEPALLLTDPLGEGYIAVLRLMTKEEDIIRAHVDRLGVGAIRRESCCEETAD